MLLLLAVVLPCAVLVALTWHVINQEQELRETRIREEQRLIVKEISQELLARVEELKLLEVSTWTPERRLSDTLDYTSEHILFAGMASEGQLLLPWETAPTSGRPGRSTDENAFLENLRQAEQLEFVDGNLAEAGIRYGECVASARQPARRAYGRLSLARVLAKRGDTARSLAEYHTVTAVDPAVTDEQGIPLCLYAAGILAKTPAFIDEVLAAIEGVLQAGRWLSPPAAFMLRDLIKTLAARGFASPSQGEKIEAFQRGILVHLRRQAEALAVQQDFPRLSLIAESDDEGDPVESVWIPHGDPPLLITFTSDHSGGRRLVIAVRGQPILNAISASHAEAGAVLRDLRLTSSSGPEAQPLGAGFPGLGIVCSPGHDDVLGGRWDMRRSFYLSALVAVLCVVAFGVYVFWRDVTLELRMAEMRSQFIASVSHELKTPLTAIRMYAETLQMGRLENAPERTEYLATIVNESHRLTRLLNNVLDFAKIEQGRRDYRTEPARLPEIVGKAVDAMQYPLVQQGFHLTVTLEPDLPEITVDKDAIEQALLNLISNAMKYSGESREITLRAARLDDHVVIEVGDHGIGIAPADQERVFEKFYRVVDKDTMRVPGTGLGLALVHHIVRAHHGRIEVRSHPGSGSTFSLHLPLETSHEPNPDH